MSDFSHRLIAWQKLHGRHDLPWQNTTDPYAIWVSEIMLQQTQVAAVMGYYSKFMRRFPSIESLASASQDEVLQYWSGLGYYSRARNLHHAAMTIMSEHGGSFPQDFKAIQALSGIGRSTAAAIVSFAFKEAQAILDGNVKRVLARHFLIEGWPGLPRVESQLWQLAQSLMPAEDVVAYTQGLMDLGATLCTRSKPKCAQCPLSVSCQGLLQQRVQDLPALKPRKAIPTKQVTMLIFCYEDKILLEKRPANGIWGGLWSFPEGHDNLADNVSMLNHFGVTAQAGMRLPKLTHTFTHFKLDISPQTFRVIKPNAKLNSSSSRWLSLDEAIDWAIPAPIRKILQSLQKAVTL